MFVNFIKNGERYTVSIKANNQNCNACNISLINQSTGHCSAKTISAEELYDMITVIDKSFVERRIWE